ncbi:beta-ketoacyl-ACP synthase [Bosea caraganae]|uniref:Beta-ketoacyl-ACP synthase n=1 Tax=Bosea caraganae TaxID=2763117 RepID=A0A370L8G4_9HYPH|nr:beta-ketoacyl-ACP synthase [Bosea caraganae]RDJ25227.1 beta-ketoacyl-ACP synthase [Bosea caraganae]RDJ26337.1 beta-ketoacyl-ACP synthase [Bosea caraganae]
MTRRAVITGMGGVTALGNEWADIRANLHAGRTAIRRMDWDQYTGVNSRLAAPVPDFSVDQRYSRKQLRTMGRVSRMAVYATEQALGQAALLGDPALKTGRCGVAYGSSFGSIAPILSFAELMKDGASKTLNATSYIQVMGHTAAVNIALFFGMTGRIIPTSTACTSGSMAIGYAYEAIQSGKADVMIAGGGDELDISDVAVFDTLFATSTNNDNPGLTPRPYDITRDGLVIGEGASTLIVEEREHALARGAQIHAEIVGFGTNCDGHHATHPQASTMEVALRLALDDAGLPASEIGFVSGHGTATESGDIAESQATHAVFGDGMPIHSLKSYFGHTLGACGALEAWLGIEMMREKSFVPTANLTSVDPRCAPLDYVMKQARRVETELLMSNNFAFGGINTSLIFRLA